MCVFSKKPSGLLVMLGAMTTLDLFIVLMTVFNASDRPHQKQADVMTALQHDGAKMFGWVFNLPPSLIEIPSVSYSVFSASFFLVVRYSVLTLESSAVLRLVSLIVAIVGNPAYCFATITVVWMMCSDVFGCHLTDPTSHRKFAVHSTYVQSIQVFQ
ncbi:hypothetical protein DFH07DRAFT_184668 [Mycena maculata]|uniref:Uncharacterized protein n=1 Tax=Mycena maculata TaxID=230809 RepID=A0AAD7MRW5_9AGAR|nr:hypothetical protein DFH07DRAFT_184668 [Mycena maculata]